MDIDVILAYKIVRPASSEGDEFEFIHAKAIGEFTIEEEALITLCV